MKIFFLVVSFLGNQKPLKNSKHTGMGREELMTDVRGTSCFVIKFGKAGEQLAAKLWEEGKMVYASYASMTKRLKLAMRARCNGVYGR
ncbi:putative translation factor (SUA5) [Streptococcus pneumoniae]|nr:putative translation factor (SUA5) [Streptococcus pneumoniae]